MPVRARRGNCRCYLPVFMLEAPVLLLFLEVLLVALVLSFLALFLALRLFILFFALRFSMVCDLLSESEEGAGAFARRMILSAVPLRS